MEDIPEGESERRLGGVPDGGLRCSSLSAEKEQAILRLFGKPTLKPGQKALLAAALAGRNTLGVLPTGYGKSLCYQAAAALMGGASVVVSPLLALMREQVATLRKLGVSAWRYDSSLEAREREEALRALAAGEARLLFVAPESLESPALLAALEGVERSLFVVDEAHCVSEWGHSFRPDYLSLPNWQRARGFRCVMALTATASLRVQRDLCDAFGIAEQDVVALSPRRPHLSREVLCPQDKEAALLDCLGRPGRLPAIVYVRSRRGGEELTTRLRQAGFEEAMCYHAGLPPSLRAQMQDDFLHNRRRLLVATIAFGMGIDKPDVRTVIHYDMPTSPEAYIQESGRAGRDEAPAESIVFLSGENFLAAHNRVMASEPDAEGVLQCVRWLLPAGSRVVSFWELSRTCDLPEEVVKGILLELVRAGAVQIVSRGYKYYTARPLFPLHTILDGREAEESARLTWLAERREGEIEAAAEAWGIDDEEALRQLRECVDAGEWKVDLRQRAVRVRTLSTADAREIAANLSASYARRREADKERLERLLDILTGGECISAALDAYFTGQGGAHCETCSFCRGALVPRPVFPLRVPAPAADPTSAVKMPEFSRENQRRRFLLGFSSPALLARRLWNHPLYGSARHIPWEEL